MSLLREVTDRLRAGGIEAADLEARVLVAHALGISPAAALTTEAPKPDGLDALIERRLRREPLQYLTGRAEFYGLSLSVGPGAHLPRPSTETLVDEALRRIRGDETVVDVCTGPGNIALAIRHHRARAKVVAIDIDPVALGYAGRNLREVHRIRGDLLRPVASRSADLVVSNPPYIARNEWDQVDPEVRFEPRVALDGGADGLDVIRRLVDQAAPVLRPGGSLLFEVGFSQAAFAKELLVSSSYSEAVTLPDAEGVPRVVAGRITE